MAREMLGRTSKEPTFESGGQSSPNEFAASTVTRSQHAILMLQKAAGNRAVGQMLQSNANPQTPILSRIPEMIVPAVLRSPSHSLPPAIRADMEQHFGQDLNSVQVHTNTQAAASAKLLNAQAYTVGDHIVFDENQYAPETRDGKQLLAHELTHVVQQEGQVPTSSLEVSTPEDRHEQEAKQQSDRLARSEFAPPPRPPITSVRPGRVQRSVGGTIAGGILGGLLGAGLGLLGLLGGPILGAVLGIVGGVLGAIGGAFLGRALSAPPMHWETGIADVPLVANPSQPQATVIRVLPLGTRVLIIDEGRNEPFNSVGAPWVKIRVTTGTDIDAQGWVMRSQLVQRPETTEVSMEAAVRLFAELSRATFVTEQDTQSPIPFHYPTDGCYARAHRMAQLLAEKGYASEKVFAVSRTRAPAGNPMGSLRVPTEFAGDAPLGQQPAVTWWYHVAPIIKVRNPRGELIDIVLDPSLAQGPITIEQWTGLMHQGSFSRLTLSELDSRLEANAGQYPVGENITFTTPRSTYFPPGGSQPDDVDQASRSTLTQYARLAQVHELAGAIRRVLRVIPVNVNAIVSAIRSATALARQNLWGLFPNLRTEVHTSLPPPDAQRVEDAISQP